MSAISRPRPTTTTTTTATGRGPTPSRAVAGVGALLGLLALGGLPALLLSPFEGADALHRVHDTAWGVLMTFGYGALLAVAAFRPERAGGSLVAAVAVMLAASVTGLAVGEPAAVMFVVLAAVAAGALWLHPDRATIVASARSGGWDTRALAIAGVGALGLLATAVDQVALHLDAAPDDPHVATEPHYLGMAVLAVAITVLGVVGARRVRGAIVPALSGAVAAVLLGVLSVALPDDAGSLPVLGGILAVVGGVAYAATRWSTRDADA